MNRTSERRGDTFLTAEDVLSYLRVNARTVYRLIRDGELPAVRVGRQWRFKQRDLDRWVEAQGIAVEWPAAVNE
jgi:excisionase family DNA binding protein